MWDREDYIKEAEKELGDEQVYEEASNGIIIRHYQGIELDNEDSLKRFKEFTEWDFLRL